eukprot:scaffold206117_cov24-Tisochrysis_lutea.AAC.1
MAGVAAGGLGALVGCQAAWVRAAFVLPPDASGPTRGIVGERPGETRNIVFLGDSLVTGVGCEPTRGEGPTLPRAVAHELSARMGGEVSWLALGETGADILSLSERLLPSLAAEAERCRQEGGQIDAVVIVCGLNDMKSCFLFCQPHLNPVAFASNLRRVIRAVRELTGEQCAVLLPGVSVDGVPRFEPFWPLSAFITAVAQMWESRKEHVAAELAAAGARVAFCSGKGVSLDASHFCRDGMHPNDQGYQFWATLMVDDLVRAISQPGSSSCER